MISVVIADDHNLVRQGLRAFLNTTADIAVAPSAALLPAATVCSGRGLLTRR